jgi:hypothetical protein
MTSWSGCEERLQRARAVHGQRVDEEGLARVEICSRQMRSW